MGSTATGSMGTIAEVHGEATVASGANVSSDGGRATVCGPLLCCVRGLAGVICGWLQPVRVCVARWLQSYAPEPEEYYWLRLTFIGEADKHEAIELGIHG
jgi:hypothetical protein